MSASEIERRFVASQLRSISDEKPVIVGYAAVFNKYSEDIGGFRERIAPGAFSKVLGDDVRALFNHDNDMVLGRSKSGTLRLREDDQGLRTEIDLPDTQFARDLWQSVKRGDVDQMSFAFRTEKDTWAMDQEGNVERTILEFKALYDVSIVTYPAYPDTSVALRAFDAFRASNAPKPEPMDYGLLRRRIALSAS